MAFGFRKMATAVKTLDRQIDKMGKIYEMHTKL